MKIQFSLLVLMVTIFSSPLFSATPHRGSAELLNPEAYSINASTTLYQSSALIDNDGVETAYPEGSAYRIIDADLTFRYGFSKKLELGFTGRFRSVSSMLNDETSESSGPESLGLEIKYSFPKVKNMTYAIGAHYRQTLYANGLFDSAVLIPSDTLILGDSGSEYGVDLFMTNNLKPWKWDLKLGYNSPANDLSSEIDYRAEIIYLFSSVNLFMGVEGIVSLNRDQYTDDPALKPVQATGSTRLFNSLNRQKLAPFGGVNFSLNKLTFTLKGQSVMAGRSTDKGQSISLGLSWNSTGVTDESIKIDSFKEYIVDGSVLKVSARGNFIRVDQGLSTDVEKGMKFDIYQTDYFGGNVLVGSGIVFDVGVDWSVIKLTKRYNQIVIKPGFAARGY
ncbi:MAG: hypothetical protein HOP07_03260 [Bacteriovoracaceae bacterium]|nr:hypothetical protein [Bacteriovoracaceae bacterium]